MRILAIVVGAAIATLSCGSYIEVINAKIGRQQDILISGRVINKWRSQGARFGPNYHVGIAAESFHRDVTFSISAGEYEWLNNGDNFVRDAKVGIFGIIYMER